MTSQDDSRREGACARVHRRQRHPRPGASGPIHLNEVSQDGTPKVLDSTRNEGEGRLRLLGGRLRQLPLASQNGGYPTEAALRGDGG